MKNLLIYTFCFFALLGCKKSERLQKDETIVSGTVTEEQRDMPIEGATVVLQEFLEDEKSNDCDGSCSRLMDSVLTDVNGHYEFNFKAKKGTRWGYNITCRKLNYIVRQESYSPHLVKEKINTANLSLIATGSIKVVFIKVPTSNLVYHSSGFDGISTSTGCINDICFAELKNTKANVKVNLHYSLRNTITSQVDSYHKEYTIEPFKNIIDTIKH